MVKDRFCKPAAQATVGSIPTRGSNFMIAWLLTFISVFVINIAYARYFKALQKDKAILASGWSASINLVAGSVAIGYIENHWLLIPSCIGSFAGTWAGMKLDNRNVA